MLCSEARIINILAGFDRGSEKEVECMIKLNLADAPTHSIYISLLVIMVSYMTSSSAPHRRFPLHNLSICAL